MSALVGEEGYRRWIRIFQIVFPFGWLLFILFDPRTLDFVLKGANANNLLLIPMAYAVLHLGDAGAQRRADVAEDRDSAAVYDLGHHQLYGGQSV